MNKIISKLKYILEITLNFFKNLLISFFGFFFDLFKNGQPSNELKAKKLDNIGNNDKNIENKPTDISGYNENPSTLSINNDYNFTITTLELENLIVNRFCEELEIKEEDLTNKEKEYIKSLNEKIIPILQNDIDNKIISNKISLAEKIKKLVIEELENQYELETNNKVSNDKIVITPLIIKKSVDEPILPTDTSTFIKNKIVQSKLQNNNIPFLNTPIDNIETIKVASPKVNDKKIYEELDINSDRIESLFLKKLDLKTSDNDNNSKNYQKNLNEYNNFIAVNDAFISTDDDTILDNTPPTFTENKKTNQDNVNSSLPLQPDFFKTKEDEKADVSLQKDVCESPKDAIEPLEPFEEYDDTKLDTLIENIVYQSNEESNKEELEDKNYEILEKQINDLLVVINKLKLKNLNSLQKNKLMLQENKLLQLKNSLSIQKQKDIALEENILDSSILLDDLNLLEEHLQQLHIEDKLDLQEYMLNSLEELDNMTIDKAKKIEKELLKMKLRRAIHDAEIPSLFALPFIRNKYFMFFTGSLFVNRHLKFFDAILKRKSIEFEPEELSHLKTGAHALEDALYISKENIDYLNYLEKEALKKYPELNFDADYLIYLNQLKNKLLKQQERLLKKENMIQKHNLRINKKIRKLKKKENQNVLTF